MSLPKNLFAKKVQISFVNTAAWNGDLQDIHNSDALLTGTRKYSLKEVWILLQAFETLCE